MSNNKEFKLWATLWGLIMIAAFLAMCIFAQGCDLQIDGADEPERSYSAENFDAYEDTDAVTTCAFDTEVVIDLQTCEADLDVVYTDVAVLKVTVEEDNLKVAQLTAELGRLTEQLEAANEINENLIDKYHECVLSVQNIAAASAGLSCTPSGWWCEYASWSCE